MNYRTERPPYRELDDDERYYVTAPIDEIRRELEDYGVRVEPSIAAVRALIDERMYLGHLGSIERISAYVARRGQLTVDETAEFVQVVRVALFENDYAIIRKFEGRSTFSTYLTTVIMRLFQQLRIGEWGKWRPSAKAKALGETAIALERLLSRDGFSFMEAVTALTCHPQRRSVEELEAIYAQLPLRNPRPVFVSDENVLAELSSEDSAEERVRASEREIAARSAVAVIDRAISNFTPEDRRILQLRFYDERTVPEIARILDLEPRKLYKRLELLLKALRRALEEAGIDGAAVGDLTGRPAPDFLSEALPERTSTAQSTSHRKPAGSNGSGR
jgi:RNA polymerase sigma factor (sigma-70 family)